MWHSLMVIGAGYGGICLAVDRGGFQVGTRLGLWRWSTPNLVISQHLLHSVGPVRGLSKAQS